jgi:hypothetical protein
MSKRARLWTLLLVTLLSFILTPWLGWWLEDLDAKKVGWATLVVAPAAFFSFAFGNVHQGNDAIFRFVLRGYLFPVIFVVTWLLASRLSRPRSD